MTQHDDLGAVFTVADALRAGWTRRRLAAPGLERPFHGVRTVIGPHDASSDERRRHLDRALAFATVMPRHAFLSHVSAAVAWDVPLPFALGNRPLDVAVFSPARNIRAAGTRGHEVATPLAVVVLHPQLAIEIASPASTWAMLGAILHDPYDLVAAGDALVRVPQHPDDPPALATRAQLEAAAHAGRRVGGGALRLALPRIRVGSSSRQETRTRLTLIDAGLPEPALAHEVFDRRGVFVARLDMAYPREKVAVEYEGEQHLTDPAQWRKDIARYERLAAEGWTVIRVTKDDLRDDPSALVARVRRALAAAS